MIQVFIALFSVYETLFLIAGILGVIYDFCLSAFSPGASVPDL